MTDFIRTLKGAWLVSRLKEQPISYMRVAGFSVTLAAHVAMLLVLLLPNDAPQVEPRADETVVQIVFLPHAGQTFRPTPPPPKPQAKKKVEKVVKTPVAVKPEPPPPLVVPNATEVAADEPIESKNLEAVLASEEDMSQLDMPAPDYPASEIISYRTAYQPVFPEEARLAGESGWVTLKVLVDAEGWPLTFILVSNTATDRLAMAAIEAVKQWKFNPAMMKDGSRVPSWIEVPIGFFNSRATDGARTARMEVTEQPVVN